MRRRPDVYLLPAIVGTGRGDVEEVLLVGRALARSGYRVRVVRLPGRSLPLLRDRTFDWTGIARTRTLAHRAVRAVTISSQFGVTAADSRDEPYGKAGPWTEERRAIDRTYGPDRVLHLSLEEFARGRPALELAEERWREAGRTLEDRRRRRATRAGRREVEEFVRLYRKFRAFATPNLLTLFPTFDPSPRFARDFPEAVETGPLWPDPSIRRRPLRGRGTVRVLWYASPSTSDRLAPLLGSALERVGGPVVVSVRSPRPLAFPRSERVRFEAESPRSAVAWRRQWERSHLAIVTGTRSLLEALVWRVPFLYFNGVMGTGRSLRRHRPEKIAALLRVLPARSRRDLSDFASLRRIEEAVTGALARRSDPGRGVRRGVLHRFPAPFGDGLELIETIVDRFGRGTESSSELIGRLRQESRRGRPARSRFSKV